MSGKFSHSPRNPLSPKNGRPGLSMPGRDPQCCFLLVESASDSPKSEPDFLKYDAPNPPSAVKSPKSKRIMPPNSSDETRETISQEQETNLSEVSSSDDNIHLSMGGFSGSVRSSRYQRPDVSSITVQSEHVVRRRSPGSSAKTSLQPGGWWAKSPKTPCSRNFEAEKKILIGRIEESVSEDGSSILATMDQEEGSNAPIKPNATDLHLLCLTEADPRKLLKAGSLATTEACSKIDSRGRLPLHCLSYNSVLIDNITFGSSENIPDSNEPGFFRFPFINPGNLGTPGEEKAVRFVTDVLVQAYPASVVSSDIDGKIPFEGALAEWVDQCIKSDFSEPFRARERFASLWRRSFQQFGRQVNSQRSARSEVQDKSEQLTPQPDIENERDIEVPSYTMKHGPSSSNFRLTSASYFSFQMLSAILDFLGTKRDITERTNDAPCNSNFERLKDSTVSDISKEIVRSVANIPKLLYVVFLLEDKDQKSFLLSTTIMKRVLTNKYSVGEWLTDMLRSPEKSVVDSGIEYLKIISKLAYGNDDHVSGRRLTSEKDSESQDEVATEISNLEGFVPSLLSLSERHVEEASTTKVVQSVLDKIMSRPFCVTIVFCDAVFLAILITGFRLAVNNLIIGSAPEQVLKCVYIANLGLFYFIEREIGRAVGLLAVTKQARVYFYSFWNLTDLLSTILALASTIAIRKGLSNDEDNTDMSGIRNLLAVTTGFLWLRVLNFLKGINMQLATFVLAVIQITKDLLWFCMIVLILVIAFSQMFFTLLAPASCAAAEDEDLCQQSEYFLETYLLLIFQEFDRAKFTTAFSVFLVVVYSFMVVLVMLNVLIAVASDSYEKCLVRSDSLFGRARVLMIAELVCFLNLLRPHNAGEEQAASAQLYKAWWSANWSFSPWSRASALFFGLALLVLVSWVTGELIGMTSGQNNASVETAPISIVATVIVFVGFLSFLSCEARRNLRSSSAGRSFGEGWFQRTMLRVLGSSGDSSQVADWKGRLLYLKEELNHLSEVNKTETAEKLKSLELNLQNDISDIRKAVATFNDEMKPKNEALQATLAEMYMMLKKLEGKMS